MLIMLSPTMLKSIEDCVQKVRSSGGMLDIYKAAEAIRLEHINENVAREDIMEKLIFFAGTVAVKFNPKSLEGESLTPVVMSKSLNGSAALASDTVQ